MFNFKKFKIKNEKDVTKAVESENKINYEIGLNTIFYVVKYGDNIDLDIKNNDVYEQGEFLALRRTLELDGIRVSISQWANWEITITLNHRDKELKVAESSIPDEFINWNSDSNFVKRYSNLEWIEKGSWCEEIQNQINSLKDKIDSERAQIQNKVTRKKDKERTLEEKEKLKKRLYFENIYKK